MLVFCLQEFGSRADVGARVKEVICSEAEIGRVLCTDLHKANAHASPVPHEPLCPAACFTQSPWLASKKNLPAVESLFPGGTLRMVETHGIGMKGRFRARDRTESYKRNVGRTCPR